VYCSRCQHQKCHKRLCPSAFCVVPTVAPDTELKSQSFDFNALARMSWIARDHARSLGGLVERVWPVFGAIPGALLPLQEGDAVAERSEFAAPAIVLPLAIV
jgi:hypothetical protein